MEKRERVYAALEGQVVDQVPLTLWQHFYKQEQTPTSLASATLAFYDRYNLDLIKLTPSPFYGIEDWGAEIVSPKSDDQPPTLKRHVINKPEDWRHLTTLNPRAGRYGQALETIHLLADQLGEADAPFLMTLYSPLTLAYQLAGENLLDHMQSTPTEVHIGLATIAETTSRFAAAVIEAGADGIFFKSTLSQRDLVSEELCEAFIVRYDLIALERVKIQPIPLILHLSGQNLYFETINQYPVHAISWSQQPTNPTLEQALTLTDKTLMTGPNHDLAEANGQAELTSQLEQMITTTHGKRLILALDQDFIQTCAEDILQTVASVNRGAT